MTFKKTQPPPQIFEDFQYELKQRNSLYELWFSYNNLLIKFLDTPDYIDDDNEIFFYFGWNSVNNGWLVRRQTRATSMIEDARQNNNPVYSQINTAWDNRQSLIYGSS